MAIILAPERPFEIDFDKGDLIIMLKNTQMILGLDSLQLQILYEQIHDYLGRWKDIPAQQKAEDEYRCEQVRILNLAQARGGIK